MGHFVEGRDAWGAARQVVVTETRDGGVFVAPQVPVNPNDVEAPAASTPLYAALVTETDDPDWVTFPLHSCPTA